MLQIIGPCMLSSSMLNAYKFLLITPGLFQTILSLLQGVQNDVAQPN